MMRNSLFKNDECIGTECGSLADTLTILSNSDWPLLQLTRLTNRNGLLTKLYQLDQRGKLSKGTKAFLTDGIAEKVSVRDLEHFSKLLKNLKPNECFTYGVTQYDTVDIIVKSKLHEHPDKIARDRKYFSIRKDQQFL